MLEFDITDCPRDAIQGLKTPIPAKRKAQYIQAALDSGFFHSVDFGSFVSHKAVPQMADTKEVLTFINKPENGTQLLAIVANERGGIEASSFEAVDILGFPFSVSEQFQLRNAGTGRKEAFEKVKMLRAIAEKHNKQLRVYISMAFGNPYNEEWDLEIVNHWVQKLSEIGVNQIALSDTVGVANVMDIENLFLLLNKEFPKISFSAHFHALPGEWDTKVKTAYKAGCLHFDGAIKGFGGCPMATNELVGNIPTEGLLAWKGFENEKIDKLTLAFEELIGNE